MTTQPRRYVKRPVEIEAVHFSSPEDGPHIVQWIADNGGVAEFHPCLMDGDLVAHPDPYILIETLEGRMVAKWGDYVIRGIAGEFYSCQYDIFHGSYDEAGD